MAQCEICGRSKRIDKLKQHLLSHAQKKDRDRSGRFCSQEGLAPDGGASSPCGSVSILACPPHGGSPTRGHEEQLMEKREAVRGIAMAIIARLSELHCDKILGLQKGRKQPFTP